jgi:cobalt-precorrin 5A hydrolase
MMPRTTVGIGCKSGCSKEVLLLLLQQTLANHGLDFSALIGIASLDRKADEPGLRALASSLQLPLHTFDAAALLTFQSRLSHRSAVSFKHTGCFGVAESCALALSETLGEGSARLLVPRQVLGGATLALARLDP